MKRRTNAELREENEQLTIQLAACMTAALGWNSKPAKKGSYGWSPAYQDVLNLRRKYDELTKRRAA